MCTPRTALRVVTTYYAGHDLFRITVYQQIKEIEKRVSMWGGKKRAVRLLEGQVISVGFCHRDLSGLVDALESLFGQKLLDLVHIQF